jgi:serine-type D-Ala-D-Ala carboxypeptidase
MPEAAHPVLEVLREGLESGVFPSAQVAVRAPARRLDLALGRTSLLGASKAVTVETRYDVASLTKALCTSVLLMQAVESGAVRLDARLSNWFPAWPSGEAITVAQLAAHQSGLPAHRPFFETLRAEGRSDAGAARRRMRELIEALPLERVPGSLCVYSDLGYLLLGWLLEDVYGASLGEAFARRVAQPLGLARTSFGPVEGDGVAATELDEHGQLLRGVVHDENARALGGVAGHAGLFSTATDVARLVGHLATVHGGASGGLVSPDTVRLFWRPSAVGSYTLGWDTPTEPSSSGRFTTRGAAVGHLGFTGCSVWHDLARQVTIVLLTNRVHPSRGNDAIKAFRPTWHDTVNGWLAAA